MTNHLRAVSSDFAQTAPLRLVLDTEMTAPPEAVFKALSQVEAVPEWYREVTKARSLDGGERREIRLRGGLRFLETVLASEPGERYVYRVDETNAPGFGALVEEWRLDAAGTGTRVRYTFAVDGAWPLRTWLRVVRPVLVWVARRAVTRLDRRIASGAAG